MGAAKQRKERLKVILLQEADRWSAPPSSVETELVAELEKLDVVRVYRAPKAQLEWARMPPRYCHDNARWYEENDPECLSKAVIGWRLNQGGVYTLHSVVEREGELTCITPSAIDGEPDNFDFVRDSDIEVHRGDDDIYKFIRKGIELGYGVRKDPQKVIEAMTQIRQDLAAGVDPDKIMRELELQFS